MGANAESEELMRRLAAVVLLALYTPESTGCYAWHQEPSPYPGLQNGRSTDEFRITLADGRVVSATAPRVEHDSLLAMADSMTAVGGQTFHVPHRIAVPVAWVTRVERHLPNKGGTSLIVGGVVLIVGGAIISAALRQLGRCNHTDAC